MKNPLNFKFSSELLKRPITKDMIKPSFNAKFSSEILNKPISKELISSALKNNKIQCKDHNSLEHIEFKNDEIYCKTCGTKLRLVPSWLIPDG